MPPASLWEQYSIIGILALCLMGFGFALRYAVKELRDWQSEEQQKTHEWQELQGKKRDDEQLRRDEMWRDFYKKMGDQQEKSICAGTEVQAKLIEQINALTLAINGHDTWARESVGSLRDVVDKVVIGDKAITPRRVR
jgi:hypothetical protein